MAEKPFSQACENNQPPILKVLEQVFKPSLTVWEIGSGTGQHACYFATQMPHLCWQPTDRRENLAGIARWVHDTNRKNLFNPVALDVMDNPWPCTQIQGLFSANTLHIMNWQEVEIFFSRLKTYLSSGAACCIYGAFNYYGRYTSQSNAQFDQWLKTRDPSSGIRDQETVVKLARSNDLCLIDDVAMPANNRLLIFQK